MAGDTITVELERLPSLGAYGAIEGRIEAPKRRKRHRFTLYDFTYDRAVNCYLERDQQDMLRDLWGRGVIVEGWVTRDPFSGRPTSIHRIRAIEPIEESEPGSYARARGILPYRAEDPPSEVAIRVMRDAW